MVKNTKLLLSGVITLAIFTGGCSFQSGEEMMDTSLGGISESFFGSPRYSDSSETGATMRENSARSETNRPNSGPNNSYSTKTSNSSSRSASNGNMDRVDNLNLNNALNNQSDNKSTTWVNPSSNKRYTVTPKSTKNSGSDYCRTFSVNTIVDGKSQTSTRRSCRVNGRWVQQ